MERETKTVKLQRPFAGTDGMIDEVVLREPVGKDVFEIGAPGQWMRTQDGAVAYIENNDALRMYAERCIVKPNALLAMGKMSVPDVLAVRDVIVGFFLGEPAEPST